MAYANGLIPSQALVSIGGGQALEANAARSWAALTAAAKKAGFALSLTDSYRPRHVQERIFFQRYTQQNTGGGPYGDVRTYMGKRYVRKAGHASAATPGTSNHGTGMAVDVTGINAGYGNTPTKAYQWLAKYAGAYGWVNPSWAKTRNFWEPWHWEYNKTLDRKSKPPKVKRLKVDGSWGPAVTRRLQEVLGTVVDGKLSGQTIGSWNRGVHSLVPGSGGSNAIRALQGVLGVRKDGLLGPNTIKALQRRYKTRADGVISAPKSSVVKALQKRLNKGKV